MQMLKMLDDVGPMSAFELARAMGLKRLSCNHHLSQLRKYGHIHIGSYVRQRAGLRGRCIPMYAVGAGEDAEPLEPIPRIQVDANYRERHRAILIARDAVRHKREVNIWAGLGARE